MTPDTSPPRTATGMHSAGAELLVLEGAGHDMPRPLWDVFVSALVWRTGRSQP